MATQLQIRRDTSANWASVNPILAEGELGLDLTEAKIKIGDGVTNWSGLDWFAGGGGAWGSITGTLSDQTDLQSALDGKEDVANKSTNTSLGSSDTLYPSQKAVKTYVDNQVSVVTIPLLIVCYRRGLPGDGEIVLDFRPALAIDFPIDMTGSTLQVQTNPASTAVYSLRKNTVEFGTLSISTGGVATWAAASGASFNGTTDRLQIVAPSPQDVSLAGVGICLKGTR